MDANANAHASIYDFEVSAFVTTSSVIAYLLTRAQVMTGVSMDRTEPSWYQQRSHHDLVKEKLDECDE